MSAVFSDFLNLNFFLIRIPESRNPSKTTTEVINIKAFINIFTGNEWFVISSDRLPEKFIGAIIMAANIHKAYFGILLRMKSDCSRKPKINGIVPALTITITVTMISPDIVDISIGFHLLKTI